MPRAIWRGSISFGLVTIPVGLYSAVRRKDVRFREIDRVTGRGVRHLRVRDLMPEPQEELWSPGREPEISEVPPSTRQVEAPRPPPEVRPSDLVRGYELEPGRYVEVT